MWSCVRVRGNIVLKFYESVARLILRLVKARRPRSCSGRTCRKSSASSAIRSTAALPPRREWSLDHLPRLVGANAIKNALRVAVQMVESNLNQHIAAEFAETAERT
jgi:fatty acid/phospholipid biosynthesis enzyme